MNAVHRLDTIGIHAPVGMRFVHHMGEIRPVRRFIGSQPLLTGGVTQRMTSITRPVLISIYFYASFPPARMLPLSIYWVYAETPLLDASGNRFREKRLHPRMHAVLLRAWLWNQASGCVVTAGCDAITCLSQGGIELRRYPARKLFFLEPRQLVVQLHHFADDDQGRRR